MELELVTIRHPHPDVGDAQVPASAVDHWRSRGWMTVEEYAEHEAAQAQEADDQAAETATAAASPPATKARRRKSSEDKD